MTPRKPGGPGESGARRGIGRPSWGDVGTWLVAFAIAVGLWLFVNTGERMSERTLKIQLEPENLPSGLVVTNPIAEHAEVRVSGPGVILSGIDPRRMRTPLDLSGVRPGVATFALSPKMFQLPRKVEVLRVTPAQVSFQVDRMARRTLPVRLEREGEVEAGAAVAELQVNPDKVEVIGPAGKIDGLRAVATDPLDFSELTIGANAVKLRLGRLGEMIQISPAEVVVQVRLEGVTVERVLEKVPVQLRGWPPGWRAVPPVVDVVVRGAEAPVAALQADAASVYVLQGDPAAVGAQKVRPQVELPDEIHLARVAPDTVLLQPPAPAKRKTSTSTRKAEKKK